MPTDDLVQRDVRFNIYSGALKALPLDEGAPKRLTTTASSTIKDLSGDEMSLSALQKMAATAENNMTIFLNHKYQVPEDVLGSVEKASITPRDDFYDLDFQIRVNESNPRALATWEAIQSGTQLGCSIGALIPEGGASKSKSGLEINDVKLLEASIVGIPANPRSFVQYAVKALNQAVIEDAVEDEIEVSGPPLQVKATPPEAQREATPPAEELTEAPLDAEVEIEGDSNATKDAPPIEGDEGDPASDTLATEVPATQEAPQSDPESDGAANEADVDEQIEAQKALGLETIAGLLKSTTHELIEMRKAIEVERQKTADAETRASESEENLVLAKQIVERLASLPIGRKTSHAAGISDFRTKFSGLYGDDVMNLLERTPDGN